MAENVCGVICEYNPFHKGHLYQLTAAREKTNARYMICVMSGPFTQRGEAAVFSPAARAEMALSCGADIVLELPYAFAVREAESFALSGVSILEQLGVVTHLCFGVENDNLPLLQKAASLIENKDEALTCAFQKAFSSGISHAKAMGDALTQLLYPKVPAFFATPNNLLGLCYCRALLHSGSSILPVTIPRMGDYHALTVENGFASATALRSAIQDGNHTLLESTVPQQLLPMYHSLLLNGPVFRRNALDNVLLYKLRSMKEAEIATLPFISEGLENRLFSAARDAVSREDLLEKLKTKRYPYLRLSRLLCHALTGTAATLLSDHPLPEYVRLLGFRKDAAPLLRRMADGKLPVIAKAADGPRDNPLYALDEKAYDIWALGTLCSAGKMYTEKVVIY